MSWSCLFLTFYLIFSSFCFSLEKIDLRESSQQESVEKEELFVRRIIEFWKDGELTIVQKQVKEFFESYPKSLYIDQLKVLLAESYIKEKKYTLALSYFNQINDPEQKNKVFLNKLQCYHNLEKYTDLFDELYPLIIKGGQIDPAISYYYAETCYRFALQDNKKELLLEAIAFFSRLKG